jgi:hypothetical protein
MAPPRILPFSDIYSRLQNIFPDGCPNRKNCVWEIAARTIFVMLYAQAVEGREIWLRPNQVTRMTDAQAALTDEVSRRDWYSLSLKSSKGEIPGRWYAVDTRESIRDDTLRNGLITNGAVFERPGLPTTSPAPRYALRESFASLFDPRLTGKKLEIAIRAWQVENLSAGSLARITMRRSRFRQTKCSLRDRLSRPRPQPLQEKHRFSGLGFFRMVRQRTGTPARPD